MLERGGPAAVALIVALALFGVPAAGVGDASVRTATFESYTALASLGELARRTQLIAVPRDAAVSMQIVDLAGEHFVLHVPPACADGGCGLLAYVPATDGFRLPPGWARVLDARRMILVAAERSGNDASVIGRRIPLAILAAHNVMQRYRVDARRVYVGGFSGGSRVALRIALAYPDVFRGALLNAGIDPIGTPGFALPPGELMARFAVESRVAFVAGAADEDRLALDADSAASLRHHGVANIDRIIVPATGHEPAPAWALGKALAYLDAS